VLKILKRQYLKLLVYITKDNLKADISDPIKNLKDIAWLLGNTEVEDYYKTKPFDIETYSPTIIVLKDILNEMVTSYRKDNTLRFNRSKLLSKGYSSSYRWYNRAILDNQSTYKSVHRVICQNIETLLRILEDDKELSQDYINRQLNPLLTDLKSLLLLHRGNDEERQNEPNGPKAKRSSH
jgi:hypothetical protein